MNSITGNELERAFEYCRKLTYQHAKNFYFSFIFLPPELRSAIYTVYAFCRIADDIADDDTISAGEKQKQFIEFDRKFDDCFEGRKTEGEMFAALQFVIKKYGLSRGNLYDIVIGVRMDLVKTHYDTFDELNEYCFKVAGRVAFVCVELFVSPEYRSKKLDIYCEKLGLALQLTNILRDIKEDSLRGRRYIPLEWLEKFHLEKDYENYIKNCDIDKLQDFMQFINKYISDVYSLCDEYINPNQKKYLFTLEIIKNIYYSLFCKMRKDGFGFLLKKRVSLSFTTKLWIALKTYIKCKLL